MAAADTPSPSNSSQSSIQNGSESRHKVELVARRLSIVLLYLVLLVVCLVVGLLYFVFVWPAKKLREGFAKEDEPLTNDWWGRHSGDDADASPSELDMRRGVDYHSYYITMQDGTKLAADVWIPKKALEAKRTLPVIYHQARYYRSATLRWPFNLVVNGGKPISFINDPFFKSFLSHDMILVSVDVRGTGASFGKHPGPWSKEEQQDSLEVLEWIDAQPWSSGRVGLWGVSYEGTSAFFTSLLRHPSVVCCCPMFFFWDVYDDLSHPGGIPMRHFSREWQGFNDSLDSGWVQSTGWMARIFLEGVSPVATEDPWGYQVKRALEEHKENWSLLKDDHIRYLDDTSKYAARSVSSACANRAAHELLAENGFSGFSPDSPEENVMRFSTTSEDGNETSKGLLGGGGATTEGRDGGGASTSGDGGKLASLRESLPFYLHVSGWLDASANAAIMAFTTLPCRGSELLVGPWSHGGHQHVRPHHVTSRSRFDFRSEVSGFFVRHLSPSSGEGEGGDAGGKGQASAAPARETDSDGESPEEDPGIDDTSLLLPKRSSGEVESTSGLAVTVPSTSPMSGPTTQDGQSNGETHVPRRLPSGEASSRAASEAPAAGKQPVQQLHPRPVSGESSDDSPGLLRGAECTAESENGSSLEGEGEFIEKAKVHRQGGDGAPAVPEHGTAGSGVRGSGDGHGSSLVEEKGRARGNALRRARPRVRFFTHQEERWHEGTTFPSTGADKADVTLCLGRHRPPERPWSTSHRNLMARLGTSLNRARNSHMAFFRSAPTSIDGKENGDGGDDDDYGGDGDGDGGSDNEVFPRKRRSNSFSGGVNGGSGGEAKVEGSKLGMDGYPDAMGLDARAAAGVLPKLAKVASGPLDEGSVSGHGGENGIGSGVAREPDAIADFETVRGDMDDDEEEEGEEEEEEEGEASGLNAGEGRGEQVEHRKDMRNGQELEGARERRKMLPGELELELEHSAAGQSRGDERDRSSVRRRWAPFLFPKLTLSQDEEEEEDVHELVVDVLNDRDGEGVSRWVAMTQFVSLISYQMDGLRSNHLRFTSPPLKQDMEVTGFPVVSIWVSADDDLPNLDVFAYLQAVRPRTGLSIYVTEGCFRAEHRKEEERRKPTDIRALPGVPIHSYLRRDAQGMERRKAVLLRFKLMPTSFRFLKGQRVRLSIGGADARHFHPITRTLHTPTPPSQPTGDTGSVNPGGGGGGMGRKEEVDHGTSVVTRRVLRVHTGGQFASSVSLPVPYAESDEGDRVRRHGDPSIVDLFRTWAAEVSSGRTHGLLGVDRTGARNKGATTRREPQASMASARRARSLSSPEMSTAASTTVSSPGLLRDGRWAEGSRVRLQRGRSEVRTSDLGLRRRVRRDWGADGQESLRLFVD